MDNRSNIESRIVTTIGSIIPVQAYVAEVDSLPYCTFTVEEDKPVNTKDGLASWGTEFTVYVVAKLKGTCDIKADAIAAAFDTARSATFKADIQRRQAYYDDELDVWGVQLEYKSVTV